MNNFQLSLFLIPIILWIIINLIIVNNRNKKSKVKISFLVEAIKSSTNVVYKEKQMKFSWRQRYKEYISLIDKCDIYFTEMILVIIPSQSFPYSSMHAPILFTNSVVEIQQQYPTYKVFKPSEVIFKVSIKDEIEIRYSDSKYGHNKYQIRLKKLSNEERIIIKEQMKTIQLL